MGWWAQHMEESFAVRKLSKAFSIEWDGCLIFRPSVLVYERKCANSGAPILKVEILKNGKETQL